MMKKINPCLLYFHSRCDCQFWTLINNIKILHIWRQVEVYTSHFEWMCKPLKSDDVVFSLIKSCRLSSLHGQEIKGHDDRHNHSQFSWRAEYPTTCCFCHLQEKTCEESTSFDLTPYDIASAIDAVNRLLVEQAKDVSCGDSVSGDFHVDSLNSGQNGYVSHWCSRH